MPFGRTSEILFDEVFGAMGKAVPNIPPATLAVFYYTSSARHPKLDFFVLGTVHDHRLKIHKDTITSAANNTVITVKRLNAIINSTFFTIVNGKGCRIGLSAATIGTTVYITAVASDTGTDTDHMATTKAGIAKLLEISIEGG